MVLIAIIITVFYLILIASFALGFDKAKEFLLNEVAPKTKFSIVIPFRNEAKNLAHLLDSIYKLNYPKPLFEVILVDDNSEDESLNIINEKIKDFINSELNILVIQNERHTNSPKKDAITTAIKKAKHEWIITTDADCMLPEFWLNSFDAFIQKTDTVCVAGPVAYHDENTFLNRFQILDIFSLQGATIGGFGLKRPFLCNGANFAYTKTAFNSVHGFEGNTEISSGDDIFLLEKIVKIYPESVHYLKCETAIVRTASQPSWNALIQQRVRWAAKTSAYNNWFGKITGLVVFLMNFLLILAPLLAIVGLFNFKIWVYILVIKLNIDFLLLYKTSAFFNQRRAFRSFLTSFCVYPFFSVYVAFIALFKGYRWKGRVFRK
ncbi:glycosyltransferase [Algibacter sp. 2305UL17-15]|uniref:glycosyltransferase family 2 protein n=1 Tax=Algibacter sp. 2305UL17-15 TaxID=3231268 RepID=UPI00345A4006